MARRRRKSNVGVYALMFLAFAGGVAASLRPWETFRQQKQTQKELQKEVEQAEDNRAQLLQQEAATKSSVAKEEMARRNGYKKPGEEDL